jgi:hypothetical protein
MKPLQIASTTLVLPPTDLVTVSTRFTKVLYAQLKSQRFSAPIAWRDMFSQRSDEDETPQEKSYVQLEMGIKVTSGFEMLITDPKNRDNRIVREVKILLDDLTTEDNAGLPTDEDIAQWKEVTREDDEKWLDINFEDFERELEGKSQSKKAPGAFGPEPPSGFGDAKTHADLKKMVERFEAFLNNEDAGVEGAEMDDMDFDDDDDDEEELDDDSEDEDKDVSFDEKEFAKMMREMMGMPSEEDDAEQEVPPRKSNAKLGKSRRIEEIDSDEENEKNESEELRKVMQRMEAELNEEGALNLDPTPKKLSALKGKSQPGDTKSLDPDSEDESDGEVNIDFNLAKNLLESFKSQAGMAGPGGNLMGMMGMQLPRDEDDAKSGRKP